MVPSSSRTNTNSVADTAMRVIVPTFPLEDETTITDYESQTRHLRTTAGGAHLQLSSAAAIAWYCLLVSVVLPILLGLAWCWYQRYRGHRRAVDALESESQLARIEANIQAFSKAEKLNRARLIRSILQERLERVTKEDLKQKRKPQDDTDEPSNYSCSICLEDFKVGDSVANSSDSMCSHCFHEECIISWIVVRRLAFCPYCRRPFLCLPAPASIGSLVLTTTTVDDMESTSRMETSVVVGLDDQTVADTLDVVVEDAKVDPTTADRVRRGTAVEPKWNSDNSV